MFEKQMGINTHRNYLIQASSTTQDASYPVLKSEDWAMREHKEDEMQEDKQLQVMLPMEQQGH